MIGSQRKNRMIFDRLRAEGVPEEQLAKVHAPIGLSIGAQTPAEIAVSIAAQLIQVRVARRPSMQKNWRV
jgi:xanthine dehydrogenase accessory factor